jgi:hypothetical protein
MEYGVTWWVMSMMRAWGAMLTITALQMAAASLAVPKSVMKTMMGEVPEAEAAGEESLGSGVLEQPPKTTPRMSSDRTTK